MTEKFFIVEFGKEGQLVFQGCQRLKSVDNVEIPADEADLIIGDTVNAPWQGRYYRGTISQIVREKPSVPKLFQGLSEIIEESKTQAKVTEKENKGKEVSGRAQNLLKFQNLRNYQGASPKKLREVVDEDDFDDDGEKLDLNDEEFQPSSKSSGQSSAGKRKSSGSPSKVTKRVKVQPKALFKEVIVEKDHTVGLEERVRDLETATKLLRHGLASSTETSGGKKKLHNDFPYTVEIRNYWDGAGKGSVGDSISCVLYDIFTREEILHSTISGEGESKTGEKLQKLDPNKVSALVAYCLFIPYPPSKYSIETRTKDYLRQKCSDERKKNKK